VSAALSPGEYLERRAAEVNAFLARCVPDEATPPTTLHKAMRYSLLGGGKRLRPVLALAAGEACGANVELLLPVACALEMVHTYSLVHDDLPAMDNDDLRRGRPTNHKVFGEATAILVGDALLTHAFLVLAEANLPAAARVALVRELASAAGAAKGMVGGQAEDLENEGKPASLEIVERIHRAKTGAMIRASVVSGGLAAGASPEVLSALHAYGDRIGLAFQIVDDLLDLTATSEELGKTAGKDLTAQKATFPAVLGVDESARRARELLDQAFAALAPLGERAKRLEQIARFIVERTT
jgi:geranylgeranyl diphosphate synthase type II